MTKKVEEEKFKITGELKFKLFLSYLCVLVLGVLSVLVFIYGMKDNEKYKFNYEEKNNIDYKVYLKENDYFTEPYLDAGGEYISSLIDKIVVDFDYGMTTEELIKGGYDYSIVARLEAKEKGKNVVIWSKEETLFESKESTFNDTKAFDLSAQTEVDYDKYNMIINDFRRANGLSVEGELIVSLVVNSNFNLQVSDTKIPVVNKASIKIPLMENTTSINTDYKPVNSTTNTIDIEGDYNLHTTLMAIGIVAFMLFAYLLYLSIGYTCHVFKYQDKYDLALRKIFRDYDSIIVEVDSLPDTKDKELLRVKDFNEILDAQMGLQEPILYYQSDKKKNSYFYVVKDNRIFMYVIKSKDFLKKEG